VPKALETQKSLVLLSGFVYFFAFTVLVVSQLAWTDADEPVVVGVDGVRRDVRPYTVNEQAGRDEYGKQVCWHCHSQFVRPVNDEIPRWGPLSQSGEYAYDTPHFFGTRRVGPDLHREGGLRPDDWHFAHFANPRFTVPLSVMPAFDWFFEEQDGADEGRRILRLLDTNGDGMVSKLGDSKDSPTPEVQRAREAIAGAKLERFDRFGVQKPAKVTDPLQWVTTPDAGDLLLTDYDLRALPTEKAQQLVEYLQRLGTNLGKWRRPIAASAPPRTSPFQDFEERPRRTPEMHAFGFLAGDPKVAEAARAATAKYTEAVAAWDARHPELSERLSRGKLLYERNCAGCHGLEGRGNGEAAPWLLVRPRDFTLAKYKYRSTFLGKLPLDGDLYRSLVRGLPGTAMPSWRELSDEQLWSLVDYIKTFYEGKNAWNERDTGFPVPPQRFDAATDKELARGRAVYLSAQAQCYNCHGLQGRGDGPGWADTATDWGGLIRPRDFRPRLLDEWGPELWTLLARSGEKRFGAEPWKKMASAKAFQDLQPTTPEARRAFRNFLLGEAPRFKDLLGGEEAVKTALGEDAYGRLFADRRDALEDLRMDVATERDQPAMRLRGGATGEDLYRTIMAGLDGTPMKQNYDLYWKKQVEELAGRKDLSRRERTVAWTVQRGSSKLSVVSGEPALHEVGVTVKKNEKGEDEEWITFQAGDDWALVHYVEWLSCIKPQRSGD
jgi:cbb3-type cytochrome c oxidase subunit II